MELKEQSHILNKIKEVERKSRIRLIIAVLISLIFAILTIFYAIKLDKAKDELVTERNNLKVVNLQLAELVTHKDSLISVIDSLRIENTPDKNFTIFLHDRRTEQRKKSKELKSYIESKGFSIAGIQKINRDFSNSIKYFHREDLSAASELYKMTVQFFKENNLDSDKVNLTYLGHISAPKGQIEIWIDP